MGWGQLEDSTWRWNVETTIGIGHECGPEFLPCHSLSTGG